MLWGRAHACHRAWLKQAGTLGAGQALAQGSPLSPLQALPRQQWRSVQLQHHAHPQRPLCQHPHCPRQRLARQLLAWQSQGARCCPLPLRQSLSLLLKTLLRHRARCCPLALRQRHPRQLLALQRRPGS